MCNVVFHVAVGNTDRVYRWRFVYNNFLNLYKSMEKIGFNCVLWYHPESYGGEKAKKSVSSISVENSSSEVKRLLDGTKKTVMITWNGSSEGDIKASAVFKKIVYGELGFFNHSSTLYFDKCGVNHRSSFLQEDDYSKYLDTKIVEDLRKKYMQPPKRKDDFIFVPLQDESDSNIRLASPFKKMDEVIEFVLNLYKNEDVKIVFKKHPKAHCNITITDPKLEEVFDNVHHYLPYAKQVIGINSNVLTETMLYHNRIISLGLGIGSKRFESDKDRLGYICNLYKKQIPFTDLGDDNKVKSSYFYKYMMEI